MTGSKAGKGVPQKRSRRAKHKVEEADAQVQELEAEQERLHRVNIDLSDRNSILEKYLQLKDSPEVTAEEWWLDPSTRNFIYSVFEPDKTITFTVCESRPLKLNGAEIAALPQEQYMMLFKMFVDAFQAAIMACKGEYVRGTPMAERLDRLCFESGALRCIAAISHPSKKFSYHLAVSAATSSAQATELYRGILKAIQLTPNQRQQMLELRRRFLRRYGAILQDRQRIAGRLQAIYPQGEFNHQSAYQYLETSKAVEELQKNLCAETCNFLQFQVIMWKNCLNPLQGALTFCRCSPQYNLDLIYLVNIIAEEEGAPSVADITGRPLLTSEDFGGEDLLAIKKLAEARIDCCIQPNGAT